MMTTDEIISRCYEHGQPNYVLAADRLKVLQAEIASLRAANNTWAALFGPSPFGGSAPGAMAGGPRTLVLKMKASEHDGENSGGRGMKGFLTDEMVQHACEVYAEVYRDDDKDMGDAMRAALTYALSSTTRATPADFTFSTAADMIDFAELCEESDGPDGKPVFKTLTISLSVERLPIQRSLKPKKPLTTKWRARSRPRNKFGIAYPR